MRMVQIGAIPNSGAHRPALSSEDLTAGARALTAALVDLANS
jgi:hypothetical protein